MIRLSSMKQNKMCKEESGEQLVVGLIVPGLVANSPDLAASVRKRRHEIVPNQRGHLSEDDDLYDELLTGGNEKKRRLTVDQVKFLEMSFNNDLKLEPERKAVIAKQLGLRPRQVAIWFQNRRARWKNKRLEQDYESLKASYNAVVQENETMVKKNETIDEENKRLQEKVTQLIGMLRSREVLCHMDARGTLLLLDSESDSENALKGRDQPSGNLDVSATKSDIQNEMLDTSGLGHPASREAIVSFLDQTFVDSVIACAAFKYEGDCRLFSPSEDAFVNWPQSVSGYHVDDHLFAYEDYYSGFKWNG